MAKITIVGDAVVITSALKLEDIRTIEKYRPKALKLMSNDGKEEIFGVGVAIDEGSINDVGVSFEGETHDDAKLATVTVKIPSEDGDIKDRIVDEYGPAMTQLNKIEAMLSGVLAEIKSEREAALNNITVVR